MKVTITIEAGKGGGKSHLAQRLIRFFAYDYDNVMPIELGIKEINPHDERYKNLMTTLRIEPHRLYQSPTTGTVEKPKTWPHNGLHWFTSERSSFRSIAQKPDKDKDEWWVIGEDEPVTMRELLSRGWQLDEKAS